MLAGLLLSEVVPFGLLPDKGKYFCEPITIVLVPVEQKIIIVSGVDVEACGVDETPPNLFFIGLPIGRNKKPAILRNELTRVELLFLSRRLCV